MHVEPRPGEPSKTNKDYWGPRGALRVLLGTTGPYWALLRVPRLSWVGPDATILRPRALPHGLGPRGRRAACGHAPERKETTMRQGAGSGQT